MVNSFPFFIKIQGIDKVSGTFKNVQTAIRNVAKSATQLGQNLTFGVSLPVIGAATLAVNNYSESLKAVAQVQAGLASTSGKVGLSFNQLTLAASKLQEQTLFDDDEILLKLTANMLTFRNVTGNTFIEAQRAAVDLSTRLGQDLQSSAIAVGKALNDPIKGLTSLSRIGVVFTENQKNMIKQLVEAGRIEEAQAAILKELQFEFGGSAKAAREIDPYTALRLEIGDLMEEFGKLIHEIITPFIQKIILVVRFIKELNPALKGLVIGGLAIAAVIGPVIFTLGQLAFAVSNCSIALGILNPLLVSLGWTTAVASVSKLDAALGIATKSTWLMNAAWLANPWVIAIGGIAALILAIKYLLPLLEKVWHWFTNLKAIKNIFGGATDTIDKLGRFGGIKPINDNFSVSPVNASSFTGVTESKNSVVVDFKNIPRGVSVTQGPTNTKDFSMNMGYSMMGFN